MTSRRITASTEPAPQDMIAGRYRVERAIGRGGMATVYLCTDTRESCSVAVKVLRGEVGNAVVVERFLREIEFVSELRHPQIPKVLDSGVVGDLPFYVMTYIEGESLKDRLDRVKQLPIEEALRITQQVIIPTAYAHSRGIVHRDIKPANILLASSGVYVLDFGIARAIVASAENSLTSTGVAVGTPAYMSPEQALADHNIDSRSDIYSLACVTYEMIAGQPPFVGPTAQAVMARRFVAPPPPLRETRESVPESVETAIARAMCKAPADRWQTVEEFGRALVARPQSSADAHAVQSVVGGGRRRYTSIVAAVALISLAAMAIVAWSLVDRDKISRGRKAIEAWDFSKAENEFRGAVEANPTSANARLWMGQLLILKRAPASEWAPFILRAADSKADLPPDDQLRAEALAAFADQENPKRCDGLRALVATRNRGHVDDFSPTVTLADCLLADPTVVPDTSSPSGHRFSSSFNEAARLYEGLIKRNPSSGPLYAALMPRLEMVLWTTKNRLRLGVMQGDPPTNFIAAPALISDTIAFLPYPVLGTGAPVSSDEDRLNRLVEQNLQRLRALATEWTRASPANADAHETLAGVLETAGKIEGSGPSALQSITNARRTVGKNGSTNAAAQYRDVRLASSNVRLLLKLHRFRQARLLADTVLSWRPSSVMNDSLRASTVELLVGLNAITGRLSAVIDLERNYAADYRVRLTSGEVKKLQAELGADVLRLAAYSAFGTPKDSILALFARISDNVESLVPPSQAADFRGALLRRPMSLATDVVGTGPLSGLPSGSNAFFSAVKAVDAKERRLAGKLADSLDSFFSSRAPGEITMDIVLQNAWLRTALGDSAVAATALDRALRGLSRAPLNLLKGAALSAALVRAMQFRADLAASAGDEPTRRKWAGAAAELWSGGDAQVKMSLVRPRVR